jgi:hypothetical protein
MYTSPALRTTLNANGAVVSITRYNVFCDRSDTDRRFALNCSTLVHCSLFISFSPRTTPLPCFGTFVWGRPVVWSIMQRPSWSTLLASRGGTVYHAVIPVELCYRCVRLATSIRSTVQFLTVLTVHFLGEGITVVFILDQKHNFCRARAICRLNYPAALYETTFLALLGACDYSGGT